MKFDNKGQEKGQGAGGKGQEKGAASPQPSPVGEGVIAPIGES